MNWNDPADRLALVERIGIEEYNKAFEEYVKQTTVVTVGGHIIRPVGTRFGRLFQVGKTGKAFTKLCDAEKYARENPVKVNISGGG